ncbi:MAG TPA: hypothetical protein VK886_22695 [Vicinamibacterales bacterium]|nr:hypothetical protein [Vicinamibacterales bacterium]
MNSRILVTVVFGFLAAAAAAPAGAQAPSPQAPPPSADESLKRRYQVNVMEGVLVGAVRHGADVLGSKLRPFNPNLVLLTGMARARGFVLDGYGVFFDVEIPALRESVAWSIRTMALAPDPFVLQALSDIRRQLASLEDGAARARLEASVARIERQMRAGVAAPGAPAPETAPSDARRVSSASVDERRDVASAPPEPAVPAYIKDPNALYTETVKNALIDAMLDHGGSMAVPADQWLTIAAKDAEGPLSPNEPYDAVTLVLRIKGSDLVAFRAERITREEARARVEVREF